MKRILISTVFALTFAACGQERTTIRTQPSEPNSIPKFAFDGNYEVSGISGDANCVYDDTTWNIQGAGDANAFNVDTATQVSFVHPTRALLVSSKLSWTEQRSYTVSGCDYQVVSEYVVWLDDNGNVAGTLKQSPVGAANCVVSGQACNYEIVSNRIK